MSRVAALWDEWVDEEFSGDPLGPLVGGGSPPSAVSFPTTSLTNKVYVAVGADLTKDPSQWSWLDISSRVRFQSGITTRQGRQDWMTTVSTSSGQLTLDNRDGRFSRRNPNGPYFGQLTFNTPIWATVDPGSGPVTRMALFVNEWPTRWDRSGNDSTVPIQCAGIMRRLQQGTEARSALKRAILASNPVAYWPLEEGVDADHAASAVTGVNSLAVSGTVGFANDLTLAGSVAAPQFSATTTGALVGGSIPSTTSTSWYVSAWFRAPQQVATDTFMRFLDFTAGGLQWDFTAYGTIVSNPGFQVEANDGFTVFLDATAFFFIDPFDGDWHNVQLTVTQSGTSLVASIAVDDHTSVGLLQTVASTTIGFPSNVTINPRSTGSAAAVDVSVAHVSVHTSSPGRLAQAGAGFVGELATTRIRRLCLEEGVPVVCTSGISPAMGVQTEDTFMNLLRECETADGGVLYETNWGLGFQALNDRCNEPVSLALDFNQRHIAVEPQPADDDQRLRNRWAASRPSGAKAVTAEKASGSLGTQAGGPGTYGDSVTVNVQADSQLGDQAGWRVHLGTVDEDRWPSIALRFHGTADLIPSWIVSPFGARVTVSNPPAQMAPDQIDAVIEGWTERWDDKTWEAVLNTAPFSPYIVGTLAADSGDTSSTLLILTPDAGYPNLAAAVTTTDTSWSINSSPLWTTNSESFPRNLMWEGEVITVTACSGASSPQTWTVTRSVNGVVKAHAAGTTGRIYRNGVLGLS